METFDIKQQSNICFQDYICMYYFSPSQKRVLRKGEVLQNPIKQSKQICKLRTFTFILDKAKKHKSHVNMHRNSM